MNRPAVLRVLRRSPGRLRVYAPSLAADVCASVAGAAGVLLVRPSERTGNVLIEFDDAVIDEQTVLELLASRPAAERTSPRQTGTRATAPTPAGWLRGRASETIRATPGKCICALIDFELYPEWQAFVTDVKVLERDPQGRGIRVATYASIGEREIEFTTTYRFPSPNRVIFEQATGELEGVRGSWMFRSLGGGHTRATYVLEVNPGWRLKLVLRGGLFEQLREAVVEHYMSELRARVERRS